MIRNDFDPNQPLPYVMYGRRSDPKNQNERSPDQQFSEIERTIKRLNYPWRKVKEYREGNSGRKFLGRVELQRMLHELKSSIVVADLILVDTPERFGRFEKLPEIRRDLYNHHGILVLSANTSFADPNTPQGRAYSSVDALRGSEEGHIKASQVVRGKRDVILRKRWAGGPVPFGYKLEERSEFMNGKTRIYRILVPDPDTSWIINHAFEIAMREGWGGKRVAQALNADSRIQELNLVFRESTVSGWLKNFIYCGVMIWPKVATDFVDDARITRAVPAVEQIRVDDYCEAIVEEEVFDAVETTRTARSAARKKTPEGRSGEAKKLLQAPAPGLAIKYPLAGLVTCSECGRSMAPSSSPVYVAKDGEKRRYTSYRCANYPVDCANGQTVREEWLSETVLATLTQRLQLELES